MPESRDMPAPVVTTRRRAARAARAAASTVAASVLDMSGWQARAPSCMKILTLVWPRLKPRLGPAAEAAMHRPFTGRCRAASLLAHFGQPNVVTNNLPLAHHADLLLLQPLFELVQQMYGARDARRGQSLDGARREAARAKAMASVSWRARAERSGMKVRCGDSC